MSKVPPFTRYALALTFARSVPHYALHWQHRTRQFVSFICQL